MLWNVEGRTETGESGLDVRTLLETPVDGSRINVPLHHSHLDGEVILERPCDLKRGFHSWARLSVGAFTYAFSHIGANVGAIGRYCSIADNVVFGHFEHPVEWLSTSSFQYQDHFMGAFMPDVGEVHYRPRPLPDEKKRRPILIGNDVWIGAGAYLKTGVHIGHGAVIGAHAVITKDVPPYAIIVGNPARIVRFRFAPEVVRKLLRLKWWRFSFIDFDGLDPSTINEAIARMEQLITDGMEPYRPQMTRIVGDGHAVSYAALEPPYEPVTASEELAEQMPASPSAAPASPPARRWLWPFRAAPRQADER